MNLLLDTQTWIYLANGYDQKTQKPNGQLHFKLIDKLEALVQNGKLNILTNEVIIMEWDRNKNATKSLLNYYKNQISNKTKETLAMRKLLTDQGMQKANAVLREFSEHYSNLIKRNQEHILRVENLLKNDSIRVPITPEQKLEVYDLGIKRVAPFHNKSSVADAIILVSTAQYLNENRKYGKYLNAFFVSNNTLDYCVSKNNTSVHPDLEWYFTLGNMRFETNLAKALEMGEYIIQQMDEINEALHRPNVIECERYCGDIITGMGIVEINERTKIYIGEPKYTYNENQLWLDFGNGYITQDYLKELGERNTYYLESGQCHNCRATHLACGCGEMMVIDYSLQFEPWEIFCIGCDLHYYSQDGKIRIEPDSM